VVFGTFLSPSITNARTLSLSFSSLLHPPSDNALPFPPSHALSPVLSLLSTCDCANLLCVGSGFFFHLFLALVALVSHISALRNASSLSVALSAPHGHRRRRMSTRPGRHHRPRAVLYSKELSLKIYVRLQVPISIPMKDSTS
jgi:hypothetical protein